MNFYCYNADELIKKIDFSTKNVTLHKHYSHYCNKFLTQVKNFSNNDKQKKLYFFVPIVIKAKKESSIEQINECFIYLSKKLDYFEEYGNNHIFFWVGDSFLTPDFGNQENFFMQSCHKNNPCKSLHYISSICEKLIFSKNINEAKIDVSFQGNFKTHQCRERLKNLRLNFNTKIVSSPSIQPQNHTEEWIDSYIDLIENSKFVLCPRGQGLNSIRFFEAISAGRIPILISNDTKLPLSNIIDWSDIIIQLNENFNEDNLNLKIKNFLDKKNLPDVSNNLKKIWNDYFLNIKNFFEYNYKNFMII